MRSDVFARTAGTWIKGQLERGADGQREVSRHVLGVYALPLRVYYLGSSFRSLGEADDVIHGFLINRLEHPDYMEKWQASGLHLRRWLINGLCLYCREQFKRRNRDAGVGLPPENAAAPDEPTPEVDNAFIRSVVAAAMAATEADCAARGMALHWSLFRKHYLHEMDYESLGVEVGQTRNEVRVKIRSAKRRFAAAIRVVLGRNGAEPGELNTEIRSLLGIR